MALARVQLAQGQRTIVPAIPYEHTLDYYGKRWGMQALWLFNGDGHDSYGQNHLTALPIGNPARIGAGKLALGAKIVSTGYWSVANNVALQSGNQDFWVSGWFYLRSNNIAKYTAITKYDTILDADTEWDISYRSAASGGPDRLWFHMSHTINGSPGATVLSSVAPVVNTWTHFFAYCDVVNNVIGFSINNGAANVAAGCGGTFNGAGPIYIGQLFGAGWFWDGNLDVFAFGKAPPGGLKAMGLDVEIPTVLYNSGLGTELT